MLLLVHGGDREKVLVASKKMVVQLRNKRPDAAFFAMDEETFDVARFEELVFARGLFDSKCVASLSGVLSEKSTQEYIVSKLKELADSENAFVFAEDVLTKPVLKKIEKVAYKVEEFSLPKSEKQEFNIFKVADAFVAKDKKNTWILFTQAMKEGVAPEQVHGTLQTQVRNLLSVHIAKEQNVSDGDLGLHPFVLGKTKRALAGFSEGELRSMLGELTHMYHRARRGEGELQDLLEHWLLAL